MTFSSNKELPIEVKNLRRIWDSKKLDIRFTQVTAAKDLGWTQGAISHYLNAITELNPAAIIKFANFLDVDPRDIDPNIEPNLPSVSSLRLDYVASDMSKKLKDKRVPYRSESASILVKIPNAEPYISQFFTSSDGHLGPEWSEVFVRLIRTSQLKHPKVFAVRLKNKKDLQFYRPENLPASDKIKEIWSVVSVTYL